MIFRRSWIFLCALAGFCLIINWSCYQQSGLSQLWPEEPFRKLSQYGFFEKPLSRLQPVSGIYSYELNSPLFSDFAKKARFVYVPEGKKARVGADERIEFPPGSVLIKNFYYEADQLSDLNSEEARIIETRLLIRTDKGWDAWPYKWNEEQTDAELALAGGQLELGLENDGLGKPVNLNYQIPNKNQCKGCHVLDDKVRPIGPQLGNLNKEMTGELPGNQIEHWIQWDILEDDFEASTKPQALTKWVDYAQVQEDLNERALSYLEINCAHCHNPRGPASTSGLHLGHGADPAQIGILKSPVAAGKGSGDRIYDIDPGDAEASILHYRMVNTEPGVRMPELGRQLLHPEGIELIEAWINAMPADSSGIGDAAYSLQ
jgi:uncharacterized repeat protein (TIGR03806 family)